MSLDPVMEEQELAQARPETTPEREVSEAALRWSEKRQGFLLGLNDQLRDLDSPKAIMAAAARAVGELFRISRVGYGEIDPAQEFVTVKRDWNDGAIGTVAGRHRMNDFGSSIIDELKQGRTLRVDDVSADSRTSAPEAQAAFRAIGTRSVLTVPLVKAGRMRAMLYFHHSEPRRWSEEEVALAEDVAERTWAAVERARAEEALREREAELARVQLIGQVGGVYVDLRDGFHNRRSPEYLRIHGLPPEAVHETHEDWVHRIHPEDRERAERHFLDTLASPSADYVGEYRIIRPSDGRVRWISAKAEIERGPDGRPLRLVGAHIDVTELKAAEEARRESEERLRLLADHIPNGMIYQAVRAPDGTIRFPYASRAIETLHGVSAAAVAQDASLLDDQILPEFRPQLEEVRRRAGDENRPISIEIPMRDASGEVRWFHRSSAPRRLSDGGVIWDGVEIEITDRKRAEAALADHAQRLSLALEASQLGDWTWDAATDMVTFSERAAELFGVPPGPQMTWTAMRGLLHPGDAERASKAVEEAVANRSRYDIEYRVRRGSDGHEVWVAAKGRGVYDKDGVVRGMIGVVQDITGRKQVEDRQSLLIRELHHRVKNTLATVQAIVGSTARTSSTIDDFYRAFVGRIVSLARTHSLLTEDEWQTVPLRKLLADELRPYDEGGRRILLQGPDIELRSDQAVPIGMAIHELTTNAAKYGALSRREGRVEVGWSVEAGHSGERRLEFEWLEQGGPPVAPPKQQGFGSRLLQRVLTTQLQADIRIEFEPDGLRLRMTAPLPERPSFFASLPG
ncbi:MAG: hypothetical protein K0S06_579 [Microvirga sp.]|nr:hypothetical protein [Microvirga sp.]